MPFPTFSLSSGHTMPGIAFGTGSTWRTSPRSTDEQGVSREVVEAVKAAVAQGFRSFDCAEYYDTERSLGIGLKESGVPREELFICSKVARPESMPDIRAAVKKQLDWIQVEHLDLLLIHTPRAITGEITFRGAWADLEALVDEGLVKTIGVSNYDPKHFDEFIDDAKIKPAVNQISVYPYIYHRSLPVIEYCQERGIHIEAYEVCSSLIRDSEKGGPLDPIVNTIVGELASEGVVASPGQILLAWASSKGFTVVTTSSKASRMQEYMGAGEFSLSPEQVERIDAAAQKGAEMGYGKYTSWK